ncbi:MAG: hypothetical protein WA019_04065 [Candidatus Moraniibacteriota bacterium]
MKGYVDDLDDIVIALEIIYHTLINSLDGRNYDDLGLAIERLKDKLEKRILAERLKRGNI